MVHLLMTCCCSEGDGTTWERWVDQACIACHGYLDSVAGAWGVLMAVGRGQGAREAADGDVANLQRWERRGREPAGQWRLDWWMLLHQQTGTGRSQA